MSKEAEMMKNLDELLKKKIGRSNEEREKSRADDNPFLKYGINNAYPKIFRYIDTDIVVSGNSKINYDRLYQLKCEEQKKG